MPRKRPVRIEDLFRLKAVGRVAMSPKGDQVAFELKRFDLGENRNRVQLILAPASPRTGASGPKSRADRGKHPVRPLTDGKHVDTLPKWSPDGTRLAFLSDRDKATCIWVLSMQGGEPTRITDREGCVSDFAWSADGRWLVYCYREYTEREKLERDGKQDEIKKRPQFRHVTRLHHKLDGVGWWNGIYTHVYIVPSAGGRARRLTSGDYEHKEPRFSPDGRRIAFLSNRVPNPDLNMENGDLYTVPRSGGTPRKITQMQGGCQGYSWSPDGRTIAYIGDAAKPGEGWKHLSRIWLVPSEGGRPRELTRDIDNNCINLTLGDVAGLAFTPVPPVWSADGSELYFLVSEGGACRLFARSLNRVDTRCLVGGDVNIYDVQRTAPDGPIALAVGTANNPGDVFVFDTAASGRERFPTQLTHVNAAVMDRLEIRPPQPLSIRNGKHVVHGWVITPPGFDAKRRYPAILEIHGGPHTQYGASFFHEMQLLASEGYVVVFTNPRGSAGYGLKFQNCIHADWGNCDYRDIMRVTRWIFSQPYIDTARVGVTGGSYGGYMTNWLVGHTRQFAAAVTQRSVVNLESMFGTSDFGYDLGNEFGGCPWNAPEAYRRQSPLAYARNIRTPLLIEHEEEDHRCPIEQAEQLFSTLKVLGREVEMIRFQGESHGLSRGGRPQNRAERLRRIVGWFRRYMPPGALAGKTRRARRSVRQSAANAAS